MGFAYSINSIATRPVGCVVCQAWTMIQVYCSEKTLDLKSFQSLDYWEALFPPNEISRLLILAHFNWSSRVHTLNQNSHISKLYAPMLIFPRDLRGGRVVIACGTQWRQQGHQGSRVRIMLYRDYTRTDLRLEGQITSPRVEIWV